MTYFTNLLSIFDEVDTNKDRRLSRQEFLAAADVLEVDDPDAVFSEMKAGNSSSGNEGYIVFDEFCLWMAEKRAIEHIQKFNNKEVQENTKTDQNAPLETDNQQLDSEIASLERELGIASASNSEMVNVDIVMPEHEERLTMEAEEKERNAAEAKRLEDERILAEMAEKAAAEVKLLEQEEIAAKKAAETKRLEEERIAAEKVVEDRRIEEARIAAEAKRLEEERIAAEKAAVVMKRLEEERTAAEKAVARAKRVEEERLAAEKAAADGKRLEEQRIATEHAVASEAQIVEEKILAGEKAALEAKRLNEERMAKEKVAIEAKQLEEERIAKEGETKKSEDEPIAEEETFESVMGEKLACETAAAEAEATQPEEELDVAEKAMAESIEPEEDHVAAVDESKTAAKELQSIFAEKSMESGLGVSSDSGVIDKGDVIGAVLSPIKPTEQIDAETPAGKTVDMTADSDMSFLSDGTGSPTKTISDRVVNTPDDLLPTTDETKQKDEEGSEPSSEKATSVISAGDSSSYMTKTVEPANESDKEKLKAIMDRRRRMEEEGVVLSDIPKEQKSQLILDPEVQSRLDRRRAQSDDGVIVAGATERRAGTKKQFGLDAEVQAQLERRRALSDDGSNITGDVDKRASTRRESMKSVQMSNDLQAIMARRRQAVDAENADI
uniref:EF-hand domain-containing protein n=1 Tax=Amphora coffeiformis TaxID=265554 RepID=A0A7S3P055_9STRA